MRIHIANDKGQTQALAAFGRKRREGNIQMAEREHRLLVADDDISELDMLRRELRALGYGKVFVASDGIEAVELLSESSPDIMLIDIVMPGMDGLSVLRRVRDMRLERLPHVAALIEPGQEALAPTALEAGAGVVQDKSALPQALPELIARTACSSRRALLGGAELESRLYAALIEMGIARRLNGFGYLMEGILLTLEDAYYQNNLSKRLYPAIARRYNTSATCVERSIRHAVETAWSRSRLSVLQREFGNTIDSDRGKPTNSEFIARMADKLRNGGAYRPGGDGYGAI